MNSKALLIAAAFVLAGTSAAPAARLQRHYFDEAGGHYRYDPSYRAGYYNYAPGYGGGGSTGGPYNYSGYVSGQPGPRSGVESQR